MHKCLKTILLILYYHSDNIITCYLEQSMIKIMFCLKLIDFRKNYIEPIELHEKDYNEMSKKHLHGCFRITYNIASKRCYNFHTLL